MKEGVGQTALQRAETTFTYLLKGSGTCEFYRFNTHDLYWQTMANAPTGASGKPFKNGSSIAAAEDGLTIYALKGSFNEFYAYDVNANVWTTLTPLPLINRENKKKKAKDGAALAVLGNDVYCLKGGNTREFWVFRGGEWTQLADIFSADGKGVKGGGALVSGSGQIFAFKGNNSLEFGCYVPARTMAASTSRESSVFGRSGRWTAGLKPPTAACLIARETAILHGLPYSDRMRLALYDAVGSRVRTVVSRPGPAGSYSLNVTSLPKGVYLLRLEQGGTATTRKLVLE